MPIKPQLTKRPWAVDHVPFKRPADHSKFYNSRKWRRVATAFRSAHPLCAACEAAGEVGPADVADHIKGLQWLLDHGADPYNTNELQSMCHSCHNKKSGKEAHRIKKK